MEKDNLVQTLSSPDQAPSGHQETDDRFDEGVTHALVLLGRIFRVSPITIADGSEDYDGDVMGTIDGIIRESIGDDAADSIIELVRKRPVATEA